MNVLSFPNKPSICQVLSLRDYLVRTAPLHHTDAIEMFIQLRKPHKSVSAQTLARWMTNIMETPREDSSDVHTIQYMQCLGFMVRERDQDNAQWSYLTTIYRKFYPKLVLHTGRW